MWFVYVLVCNDKSLYTGIAIDPEKRFQKHAVGMGGKYTRSHKPMKIVYLEKLQTRSEALKREWEIKSWPRKTKIQELRLKIK
jgi:putative endonuclease